MGILKRLRNLVRREHIAAEVEAELCSHLEMRIEDNLASGMSPDEAERVARLRLGNVAALKEQAFAAETVLRLETLGHDLRQALRQARGSPGFLVTVTLTLGLGIGANTAIFSFVEGVLLRPLPYKNPDRLVVIWQSTPEHRATGEFFNYYREFQAWQQNRQSFEKLAALSWATGVESGPALWHGKPIEMGAFPVSIDFFTMLGAPAQLGRTFAESDLSNGCTLVLSYRAWQEKLGAAADLIGKTLDLGHSACQVVGVMPKRFEFYPPRADAWKLITPSSVFAAKPWEAMTGVFGRLKPGVTRDAAASELAAIQSRLAPEAPQSFTRTWMPVVLDMHDEFTWLSGRNLRQGLWLLLGASSLILLMACVNIANLLLARSLERSREMAIRIALGAGRARLIRQLVIESSLLALSGIVAGVALADALLRLFGALNPFELPPGGTVAINWPVLAFAALTGILSALAFGLVPAWRASRVDPNTMLKSGGQAPGHGASAHRAARSLVFVQVALSMLLLGVSGLLAESLFKLVATDVGYSADHLFTARVDLSGERYPDPAARSRFVQTLAQSFGSLREIQSAAFASRYLPSGAADPLSVAGHPDPREGSPGVNELDISPDYFSTLRIPLLRGRLFAEHDAGKTQPVAIISDALARSYFRGENPLGHAVKLGRANDSSIPWLTIVGVVGDVKTSTVFQEMGYSEPLAVYRPIAQTGPTSIAVMINAKEGSPALLPELQRRVSSIDPTLLLADVGGMQALRSADLAQPRFRTLLLGGFSMLALALALVGLYGVLAQMVLRRRRDIGVRMALGADRTRVLKSVLWQACLLTVAGVATGTACAAFAIRLLPSLLYGIHVGGARELAMAAAAMMILTFCAAWGPARRASSIDPIQALRME